MRVVKLLDEPSAAPVVAMIDVVWKSEDLMEEMVSRIEREVLKLLSIDMLVWNCSRSAIWTNGEAARDPWAAGRSIVPVGNSIAALNPHAPQIGLKIRFGAGLLAYNIEILHYL
jgi:hypothetical protein